MLEGNVEIGRDQAVRHQGNDLIDMRIGIDIVEPDPGTQLAQLAREVRHMRLDRATLPLPFFLPDIDAVGRCVLADDQQFLGARCNQLFRFTQHGIGAATDKIAADRRNDAEGAAMIAAL